jgi:hypothetical protein
MTLPGLRNGNEPFILICSAGSYHDFMVGMVRGFLTALVTTLVVTSSANASPVHCRNAGESEPVNRTEPAVPGHALTAVGIMSWSGSDVGQPGCVACTMPGCPLALCSPGAMLDSPASRVPDDSLCTASPIALSPLFDSQTLVPPKPPPNPLLVFAV